MAQIVALDSDALIHFLRPAYLFLQRGDLHLQQGGALPLHLDVVLGQQAFEHGNIHKDQGNDSGVDIDTLGLIFKITARPGRDKNEIAAEHTGNEGQYPPAGGHHLDQHAEGPPQEVPLQIDHGQIEHAHQQDVYKSGEAQGLRHPADHGGRQCGHQDLRHVIENRLRGGVACRPVGEKGGRNRYGKKKQPEQQQFPAEPQQNQAGGNHPNAVNRHDTQQLPAPEAKFGHARHHSHRHDRNEKGAEDPKK